MANGRLWQHRFWDHVIRNENDYVRHVDYIHYNPVKHGLTPSPFEYELSSINRWAARGYYDRTWGTSQTVVCDGDFGE
jgi:putative transposase